MNHNQARSVAASKLRRLMSVLGIVLAAEVIVAVAMVFGGGQWTETDLVAGIVRILLVAVSGWFLLAKDTGTGADADVEMVAPQPGMSEQPAGTAQLWPNIDELTHTPNQRGLTIHLLEMIALAERYSHRLSVCMIQLDGLDALTDEEHEDSLISCSGLLTEMVRIPDKVGRYDGDLFMVIMPEADYAGASLVARRLESALEKELSGKARISLGVAEFERGDDLQRLLNRAQEALDKNIEE